VPGSCRRRSPTSPVTPARRARRYGSGTVRIRQILAAAGWRDIEIAAQHASILIGGGSVDDAVEFLRTASMGRTLLAGAGAGAGTAARAIASVRAALTPYADAGGVHLDAAVWLVQAMAP
jgi:hypothetical protein